MELKDKSYHFPCVLDRCVFLATALNFWPGPIIAILIYVSYTEIEKKEKSQSTEAGINALCIWYSSFIHWKKIIAIHLLAVKKDLCSVVKLISTKIARFFSLADCSLLSWIAKLNKQTQKITRREEKECILTKWYIYRTKQLVFMWWNQWVRYFKLSQRTWDLNTRIFKRI